MALVSFVAMGRPNRNIGFEVLTAVTMKNAVFWDIETQFVLHRGHIKYPL
jgi:hypothetical protein